MLLFTVLVSFLLLLVLLVNVNTFRQVRGILHIGRTSSRTKARLKSTALHFTSLQPDSFHFTSTS